MMYDRSPIAEDPKRAVVRAAIITANHARTEPLRKARKDAALAQERAKLAQRMAQLAQYHAAHPEHSYHLSFEIRPSPRRTKREAA